MTELSTSIILLTYRRDDATEENVARLDPLIRHRPSVEVILVDNNADGVDRRYLLAALPRAKLVTAERNAGVAGGRNLGDRQSVVSGKSVSVRVDVGGRRIINKKKKGDQIEIRKLYTNYLTQ